MDRISINAMLFLYTRTLTFMIEWNMLQCNGINHNFVNFLNVEVYVLNRKSFKHSSIFLAQGHVEYYLCSFIGVFSNIVTCNYHAIRYGKESNTLLSKT